MTQSEIQIALLVVVLVPTGFFLLGYLMTRSKRNQRARVPVAAARDNLLYVRAGIGKAGVLPGNPFERLYTNLDGYDRVEKLELVDPADRKPYGFRAIDILVPTDPAPFPSVSFTVGYGSGENAVRGRFLAIHIGLNVPTVIVYPETSGEYDPYDAVTESIEFNRNFRVGFEPQNRTIAHQIISPQVMEYLLSEDSTGGFTVGHGWLVIEMTDPENPVAWHKPVADRLYTVARLFPQHLPRTPIYADSRTAAEAIFGPLPNESTPPPSMWQTLIGH